MVCNRIGLAYQGSTGSRDIYECSQAGPSLAGHQNDPRPDQPYVDLPVAAEDTGGNSQGCGVCGEAQRPVAEGAWRERPGQVLQVEHTLQEGRERCRGVARGDA